jgi:hypothetical protein
MTKTWWMQEQENLLELYSMCQISREELIEKLDELNRERIAGEESTRDSGNTVRKDCAGANS